MKARLRTHGGVANPRDSYGYRCGLRLALGTNPSLSLCSSTSGLLYQESAGLRMGLGQGAIVGYVAHHNIDPKPLI
ncbi:MAG: hypothetical protein JSS31_00170 [Proteobacteria bacterium]|nr:hypothetical protein [Pseudomonadota bacterium]